MFTNLIESRPAHEVHAGEALVSTILHVGPTWASPMSDWLRWTKSS